MEIEQFRRCRFNINLENPKARDTIIVNSLLKRHRQDRPVRVDVDISRGRLLVIIKRNRRVLIIKVAITVDINVKLG